MPTTTRTRSTSRLTIPSQRDPTSRSGGRTPGLGGNLGCACQRAVAEPVGTAPTVDRACSPVGMEAWVQGVSTRKADDLVEAPATPRRVRRASRSWRRSGRAGLPRAAR